MKKYARVGKQRVNHPSREASVAVWRVQALVDIPEHNVSAGEFGGYIDRQSSLDQVGSCWIGANAYVLDGAIVKDSALVTHSAVVSGVTVENNAKIYGSAVVTTGTMPDGNESRISDFAEIYGFAEVAGSVVKNYSKIYGSAVVTSSMVTEYSSIYDFARVIGPGTVVINSHVYGEAEVQPGSKLYCSRVHCSAKIMAEAKINTSNILGAAKVLAKSVINRDKLGTEGPLSFKTPAKCEIDGVKIEACSSRYKENTSYAVKRTIENVVLFENENIKEEAKKSASVAAVALTDPFDVSRLREIEESYGTYEKDIVKLIKYPVMSDLTDEYTSKFHSTLRKVRRFVEKVDEKGYESLIDTLEDAFFAAESNARKISLSLFSDEDRAKVSDARQMIAMALDEGASETEKKNAYKGAMRNLEGKVSLPDATIFSLLEKIGLKELEA